MELRDLAPVLTADGPFVTVLLESESDVEQAAGKYELEWRNALRELAGQGVDEHTLAAIEAAKGSHADGEARLVVATPDDHAVLIAVSLPRRPLQPIVDVGPLPHLLPLVDALAGRVPYVVVQCDRTGADISAWSDAEHRADTATTEHEGDLGSWKHAEHQHLYEQGWNAAIGAEIAATTTRLAAEVGAQVLVGVGDQRALTAVLEHLPVDLQPLWTTVEGGRGGDGSEELVDQRVRDRVAEHAVTRMLDQLEDYAQERGQRKRACDGVAEVVAALRKGQVATLLITTAADPKARLWFGPEPSQVAMNADELKNLGVPLPYQGSLVDVLIRAAVGTGADVQLVPHELPLSPHAGVGALLRYADSS